MDGLNWIDFLRFLLVVLLLFVLLFTLVDDLKGIVVSIGEHIPKSFEIESILVLSWCG